MLYREELAANKAAFLTNGDVLVLGSTHLVVQIVDAGGDDGGAGKTTEA